MFIELPAAFTEGAVNKARAMAAITANPVLIAFIFTPLRLQKL